ncbi:MAG: DegT/DnrJ/EryC1/StrS family aminotransferase [Gemmatimonadota bacterium]|nr:MAG: DegT/DnrJ/EryC1/StrS family aminotransferase [Gemmatimonadota bacterium]
MSSRQTPETKTLIPLFDLARQHVPIAEELISAVARVAEAQNFVLGAGVAEFEAAAAQYIGVGHTVGVASGTDALYLALRLLGLQPGDEIITSPFTFFATAGAIENAGGRIVFADIDPRTFNLDPTAVAAAISSRTRAILPVHLFGQMAEMGPLLELAAQRGLWLIEDAAQSIGAKALVEGRWRSAGTLGTVGCFSFYPTKNLGGWGDGGLVSTDDPELAERLRRLRVHGEDYANARYVYGEVGTNSRLDAIQAAVLHVKLRHLPGWTETRRARAAGYDQRLGEIDAITTPTAEPDRFHVYSLYTIRAPRRDQLREHLGKRGIGTGVYYPLPLHLQPCFGHLGYRAGDLPEAERAAEEVLSLPLYPELTVEEQARVAAGIAEFYGA